MKKTLIIVAHPIHPASVTTTQIAEYLKDTNEAKSGEIQFRNLITLYPDYKIDKKAEQETLLWAETVVLQFPFYWYSIPGILKTWIDEVLEYGFAYGKTGDKLKGKHLILSFSTGGPAEAYAHGARNNYEIEELLFPIIQTSNLIGTILETPIVSFGMPNIPGIETNKTETVKRATEHAERLYNTVLSL
ncbi:MAG TPA: NAD(P)H-dependent oxidoreductase [Paludibacter sp.]|nr:NAD(P)H-dependent oxidoreductase [Paludibacter sp.]